LFTLHFYNALLVLNHWRTQHDESVKETLIWRDALLMVFITRQTLRLDGGSGRASSCASGHAHAWLDHPKKFIIIMIMGEESPKTLTTKMQYQKRQK
jgi:hypothetical protein